MSYISFNKLWSYIFWTHLKWQGNFRWRTDKAIRLKTWWRVWDRKGQVVVIARVKFQGSYIGPLTVSPLSSESLEWDSPTAMSQCHSVHCHSHCNRMGCLIFWGPEIKSCSFQLFNLKLNLLDYIGNQWNIEICGHKSRLRDKKLTFIFRFLFSFLIGSCLLFSKVARLVGFLFRLCSSDITWGYNLRTVASILRFRLRAISCSSYSWSSSLVGGE